MHQTCSRHLLCCLLLAAFCSALTIPPKVSSLCYINGWNKGHTMSFAVWWSVSQDKAWQFASNSKKRQKHHGNRNRFPMFFFQVRVLLSPVHAESFAEKQRADAVQHCENTFWSHRIGNQNWWLQQRNEGLSQVRILLDSSYYLPRRLRNRIQHALYGNPNLFPGEPGYEAAVTETVNDLVGKGITVRQLLTFWRTYGKAPFGPH